MPLDDQAEKRWPQPTKLLASGPEDAGSCGQNTDEVHEAAGDSARDSDTALAVPEE